MNRAAFLFAIISTLSQTGYCKEHIMIQAGKTFIGDLKGEVKLVNRKDATKAEGKAEIGEDDKKKIEGATKTLTQQKKNAVTELEIKVGDKVLFYNAEGSNLHNVKSSLFELESQGAGEYDVITFDKPGETEVECLIHPKMRFKLIVKP